MERKKRNHTLPLHFSIQPALHQLPARRGEEEQQGRGRKQDYRKNLGQSGRLARSHVGKDSKRGQEAGSAPGHNQHHL